MFNFNGSTAKKRIVNLGGNRRQINKSQLLEQTRLEREKRECQRLEENAAVIIQSRIRGHQDLNEAKRHIYQKWSQLEVSDTQQYLRSVSFTIRYAATHNLYKTQELEQICRVLEESDITLFTTQSVQNLLEGVLDCLSRFPVNTPLLHILETIQGKWGCSLDYKQLIPILSEVSEAELAFSLIVKVGQSGDPEQRAQFIRFLSKPQIVRQATLNIDLNLLNIGVSETDWTIEQNEPKFHFLVNYIDLVNRNTPFFSKASEFPGQYQIITSFIKVSCSLGCSVVLRNSLDDGLGDGNPASGDLEVSEPYTIQMVERLYSFSFIQRLSSFLKHNSTDEARESTALLLAYLVNMVPGMAQTLFIHMTIDFEVNYFEILCKSVISDARGMYDVVVESDNNFIRLDPLSARSFFTENCTYWHKVHLFQEYFQYFLVILTMNESRTHNQEYATMFIQKDTIFPVFLKKLCLTLLFNEKGLVECTRTTGSARLYHSLVSSSVSLFRKLHMNYLKNGKTSASGIWELNLSTISVHRLLPFLIEQESKRLKELSYDSSDDDMNVEVGTVVAGRTKREVRGTPSNEHAFNYTLLQQLPFLIPFKTRVEIFQSLVSLDFSRVHQRGHRFNDFFNSDAYGKRQAGNIRRQHIIEDAYAEFGKLGDGFKEQLSITFYNEYDGDKPEAGIDGGGITKEFLTSIVRELSSSESGYFQETPSRGQLYPNPDIYYKLRSGVEKPEQLHRIEVFKFLGNVIGKCLYETVLIDMTFSPFFMSKWQNSSTRNVAQSRSTFNDLRDLDSELHHNLVKLLQLTGEDLASLDLNFTINEVVNGEVKTFDLIAQGSSIRVDEHNRLQYLQAVADFKLNRSLSFQTVSFVEGLYEMIPQQWLNMFNPFELQMLLSGGEKDINVDDLKQNVQYGGYDLDIDSTIRDFWEIFEHEMTPVERFKLIKFVTSVPRAPLLGFASLTPRFGIRNAGFQDRERLPTASTCVNLLKLPDYRDKKVLKEKLLYAINAEAGFDLS